MQITVTIREVYGRRLIYPVCERAYAFCRIANAKCIPWSALEHIKELGFTVVEQHEDQLSK